MKYVSWNIDGLNSALENKSERGKMSYSVIQSILDDSPDIIAIQEIKLSSTVNYDELNEQQKQTEYISKYFPLSKKHQTMIKDLFPDYKYAYNVSTAKKGYAGTLTLYKGDAKLTTPIIGSELGEQSELLSIVNREGRITTLEFDEYYFVNVYTPNSGKNRFHIRHLWDSAFKTYIKELENKKPVVICGDFNVAHQEIDLKNPKNNHDRAGFTDNERNDFTSLLNEANLVDTFREINGPIPSVYSWWTQLSKTAKANNSGWRIDYFLISERIKNKITSSTMIDSGERKDHTPIYLELNI